MSTRLSTLIAAAALLIPMSTAAYATPEEVMIPGSSVYNFARPPTTREISGRLSDQQQRGNDRRAQEQEAAFAAQHAAAPDGTTDGATGTDMQPTATGSLEDVLNHLQQTLSNMQAEKDSPQAKHDQRILDRIEREKELQGADGQVLHSGAPLTPSGPGMWVTAIALGAAIAWTLLRAKPGKRAEA